MQLSKLEHLVYDRLKKNRFVVFRARDLRRIFAMDATQTYNVVKALKKKRAIVAVRGGTYTFDDAHEFAVATALHYPSYISFWSALNYYGWSDQTPRRIFLATPKYAKSAASFVYVTIASKRFFGYVTLGEIVIAEKEKALTDALLLPRYAGGMQEVRACFKKAYSEINIDKLISYARRVQRKAVIRRLGFMLEQEQDVRAKKLLKHIGKGYELFDPTLPRKNKFNKRWLLDINEEHDNT